MIAIFRTTDLRLSHYLAALPALLVTIGAWTTYLDRVYPAKWYKHPLQHHKDGDNWGLFSFSVVLFLLRWLSRNRKNNRMGHWHVFPWDNHSYCHFLGAISFSKKSLEILLLILQIPTLKSSFIQACRSSATIKNWITTNRKTAIQSISWRTAINSNGMQS